MQRGKPPVQCREDRRRYVLVVTWPLNAATPLSDIGVYRSKQPPHLLARQFREIAEPRCSGVRYSLDMAGRATYKESCAVLQEQGWVAHGECPKLPARPPRYDDVESGVSFFRTRVAGLKIQRLTLPRTFIARSDIEDSSFEDCDLSESVMNWNDFENVDFTSASLRACDLRSYNFHRANFRRANLKGADLRHCRFESCHFTDADLTGSKLGRGIRASLALTKAQIATIDWQIAEGPEPSGG